MRSYKNKRTPTHQRPGEADTLCFREPRVWQIKELFPCFLQKCKKSLSWKRFPPGQRACAHLHPSCTQPMACTLLSEVLEISFHLGGWQDAYVTITCREPLTYTLILDNHATRKDKTVQPQGTQGSFVRRHPTRNMDSSVSQEPGEVMFWEKPRRQRQHPGGLTHPAGPQGCAEATAKPKHRLLLPLKASKSHPAFRIIMISVFRSSQSDHLS